jgi:hypothetical protein
MTPGRRSERTFADDADKELATVHRDPLIIFAPYLPLRQAVTAGQWWVGPLAFFPGPWRDSRFESLARQFIASYTTASGAQIKNPTLVARRDRGADGSWPELSEMRSLQLATDFTVLNNNPPWTAETVQYAGWTTATSDNSQLHFWPVDTEHGRVALSAGTMLRSTTAGYTIEQGLTVRAPLELHMPNDRLLDGELLGALLSIFDGERDAIDASLGDRLAVAATWLSQTWRNTESIRVEERIIMLKTGFEALTDASNTAISASRLNALFGELRDASVTDFTAQYLLWKPNETPTMSWTTGKGEVHQCTPLEHWFSSFGRCRNDIVHKGQVESMAYDVEGSAYNGPYLFIAERVLREACRVAMRRLGFKDLWKESAIRLLSRLLPSPFAEL